MTTVTHPHASVTICNTLWASGLSFSPFSAGDQPLTFDSLFPEEKSLVDTCREAGLDREPLNLSKLLLASHSYNTLGVLLKAGVVTVAQPFTSGGQATLAHVACALATTQAIQTVTKTLNGTTNSSSIWSTKDEEGRTPEEVCFNHELARKLPHRNLFGRKKQAAGQPLRSEDRERIFQLARQPDSFYSLIINLQTHQFNVNTERDDSGDLLIHIAVQGGLPSLPLLLTLLNHFGADVNGRDRNGMTPLSLACRLGHSRVAEVLVCVGGADVKLQDPTRRQTALHCASLYGHPDIIRMLLRRGANPSIEDSNKCDPAFLARKAGFHECRQILTHHIKNRFSILATQTENDTLDVAKVRPSDVCYVPEDGATLLILAARCGHAHLLRQLIHIDKDNCPLDYREMKTPDLLDTSMELSASLRGLPSCGDHPFKTALHYACQAGHHECVRILLNAHAHPSLPDNDSWLPLHHACDGEHLECVRAILGHQGGLRGLTSALSLARERGNSDIITLLQEAASRRQTEIVTPALFDAAILGSTNLLFTVLENGDDVNPVKEESHDWPLLLAAGGGYLDMVQHLMQFGGHVTRSHSNTGLTPLHVAARGGWDKVVTFLLKFTDRKTWVQTEEGEGESEGGKNINCRNKAGATPLELAAAQGHKQIVRMLLDAGASCSMPDSTGRLLSSPEFGGVQHMLETCRRDRVQTICDALERGVPLQQFQTVWQGPWDYNLRAESGDTILMVAAEHAPFEVLRFLLVAASHAPPTTLIAGGIPTPLPGKRMTISPEGSDHAHSDTHTRDKELLDSSSDQRPASAHPVVRRQRRHTLDRPSRFPFQRSRNKPRSPRTKPKPPGHRSSGASNVSSEEEGGQARYPDSPEISVPSNTGICSTIIRAVNPHDGQTALHRAAETGQHESVTLLLKADPECACAIDRNGDTALHMACRNTQKKIHRKTVDALLACDKVDAYMRNNDGKLPEDMCPHSWTRRMVIKRREKDASKPTDPRELLQEKSGGLSAGSQNMPLSYTAFDERMAARKQEFREVKAKSSTSDQDTSN